MPVETNWQEMGCDYQPTRWKGQPGELALMMQLAKYRLESMRGETPELATEIVRRQLYYL